MWLAKTRSRETELQRNDIRVSSPDEVTRYYTSNERDATVKNVRGYTRIVANFGMVNTSRLQRLQSSRLRALMISSRKQEEQSEQCLEVRRSKSSDGIPAFSCVESWGTASRVRAVLDVVEGPAEGVGVDLHCSGSVDGWRGTDRGYAYRGVDESERLLAKVETDVVDGGEESTNDRSRSRSAKDSLEAALKSDGVVGTMS